MPHKNQERRAQCQRERRQRQRNLPPPGDVPEAPPTPAVPPLPLRSAADCLRLLGEQVNSVRSGGAQTTARTIAYLLSVGLRAVELATIEARLEAVERVLKVRGETP
jgi:hypothetical protein